jgi:protein-arginine kinase activator protein McsA
MDSFPVCTQCGFTLGEYRSRGLLGCPHCYASFGDALQADLLWMHHALQVQPPEPAVHEPHGKPDPESLARWRRELAEAIKIENYGEAARLHLLILSADNQEKAGGRLGLG